MLHAWLPIDIPQPLDRLIGTPDCPVLSDVCLDEARAAGIALVSGYLLLGRHWPLFSVLALSAAAGAAVTLPA